MHEIDSSIGGKRLGNRVLQVDRNVLQDFPFVVEFPMSSLPSKNWEMCDNIHQFLEALEAQTHLPEHSQALGAH